LSSKAGRPIIIIRKHAASHDDEHGGAWKVAYADFVTAMMALFIVLWLLSASEKVQKAVGGYFLDPSGKGRQTGTTNAGQGETLTLNRDSLKDLKEKLEQVLRQIPAFQHMEKQIRITLTTEGLRIDLIETERGLFFDTGNPKPSAAGVELLKVLAAELVKLPNKIAIEGHTDSRPYGRSDYSNWELSADRANAARRVLADFGMDEDRISQVRGFADQRLMKKDDPTSPSNRRISIIVRNEGLDTQEEAMAEGSPAAKTGPESQAKAGPEPQAKSGPVPATKSGPESVAKASPVPAATAAPVKP
jgi:chemotaxis protein MotB